MSSRRTAAATETPSRVADPSDHDATYTAPRTRSAARRRRTNTQPVAEAAEAAQDSSSSSSADSIPRRRKPRIAEPVANGQTSPRKQKQPVDGAFLTPSPPKTTTTTTTTTTTEGWSWQNLSRSPSPLGLIPIHRHFRTFVHRHEVPRKALHVSIGFFVAWLYTTGTQTSAVPPYLMAALVPVAATDLLRHRFAPVNRLYVRVLGALMRESEYAGYNGVIWYLAGAWAVLRLLPKDVGVMSVLLLSWCDTAASTFGRLWGHRAVRLRQGKSLAGTLAAFSVGVATSCFFYGWLVPVFGPMPGDEGFMFRNVLALPKALVVVVGSGGGGGGDEDAWSVTGGLALGVVSVVSGLVASASELVDFFGWDDNLTIPVLSGLGLYGFLKVFG